MLEIENKLIMLLKKGVTFAKLKSKTGLCSAELVKKMNALKNKGYVINRQFNDDGVKFMIGDRTADILQDNIKIVYENRFTFLVMADTHIGNVHENMDLVKNLYKYAQEKNIKYVFHLGDMVEGTSVRESKDFRIKRDSVDEQIDYLTRTYPKYDSINTLYILGNHDNRWLNEGIDISKIIDNRRYDMHFLGYKNSKIVLGNRNVLLNHPFIVDRNFKYDHEIEELYPDCNFDLVLRGHTHHNGIYVNDNNSIVVNVPACYDSPNRKYVGVYEITLTNEKLELDQLIVSKTVDRFSRIKFDLNNNDNNHCNNQCDYQNVKKKKR